MRKFSFFIGSDISKSVIDISYFSDGESIYLGEYLNSIKGFKLMLSDLCKVTDVDKQQWFFCFENTGIYSKPLLKWLFENNLACKEENALKISKSLGLRRGKDDQIDSKDICQYAFEKRDSIEPTILAKPIISKLKKLLSHRDFLVGKRQSIKIAIKEQKGFIEDDLFVELEKGNNKIIEAFNMQIKELELSIKNLISSDEEMSNNDKLARSVIGIGAITSANIIAVTQNYTCFSNARKFACYCGVAPFPNSSGIRKGKTKVSHIANKKMKSLFSNCIMAAIRHDPELAVYYHRKLEQGKRPGIVLNALKNKIIHRVFAVVKRNKPYVKLVRYV